MNLILGLISTFIPGSAQFMAGRILKGPALFISVLLLWNFLPLLGAIIWIYNIIDALRI